MHGFMVDFIDEVNVKTVDVNLRCVCVRWRNRSFCVARDVFSSMLSVVLGRPLRVDILQKSRDFLYPQSFI